MADINFNDLNNSDFLQTLNEQLGQLEEWRSQIREGFGHLSNLAEHHLQRNEDLHFPDKTEAQVNTEQLRQHFEQAANTLETDLNLAISTLGDHLQTCKSEWEQTASRCQQMQQTLLAAGQQCGETCQGVADTALQGFDGLGQDVQNLVEVLQSMTSGHDHAFSQLSQSLNDQWPQNTQQFSSAFHNDLSDTHVQRLAMQFNQGLQQVGQLHDHLNQGTQEINDDFGQNLTDLFQNVSDHIGDKMQSGLQNAASNLVEGATQRFSEELIESVIMTQAGVGVTSALGPWLPELKIIEKVSDAVIAALEALNDLKKGDLLGAVGIHL